MISSGEEELLDYDSRIDITRDTCPMTFVRTRLALDRMAPGQVLWWRCGAPRRCGTCPARRWSRGTRFWRRTRPGRGWCGCGSDAGAPEPGR